MTTATTAELEEAFLCLASRWREFIIDNEAGTEAGKGLSKVKKLATGEHLYAFEATLRLPKDAGKYLLRVDCLDLKVDKYPQSLIATQSLFILVETRAKPKAKGHSITIGKENFEYGTGGQQSFPNLPTLLFPRLFL